MKQKKRNRIGEKQEITKAARQKKSHPSVSGQAAFFIPVLQQNRGGNQRAAKEHCSQVDPLKGILFITGNGGAQMKPTNLRGHGSLFRTANRGDQQRRTEGQNHTELPESLCGVKFHSPGSLRFHDVIISERNWGMKRMAVVIVNAYG